MSLTLRTDPALRRPPPPGMRDRVVREGKRRRRRSIASGATACVTVIVIAVAGSAGSGSGSAGRTTLSPGAPRGVGGAVAGPDTTTSSYRSHGHIVESAAGHPPETFTPALISASMVDAQDWRLVAENPDGQTHFGLVLHTRDDLATFDGLTLAVPDSRSATGYISFAWSPRPAPRMRLAVGERSTGVYVHGGSSYVITVTRPEALTWQVAMTSTPQTPGDVSPSTFTIRITEDRLTRPASLRFVVTTKNGNGQSLNADLRGARSN